MFQKLFKKYTKVILILIQIPNKTILIQFSHTVFNRVLFRVEEESGGTEGIEMAENGGKGMDLEENDGK